MFRRLLSVRVAASLFSLGALSADYLDLSKKLPFFIPKYHYQPAVCAAESQESEVPKGFQRYKPI